MFPSSVPNIFLILDSFSFFTIAAIDGPFPETDAPSAPFSIKSTMILGSEFKMVDVANPLIIIDSQYFFSFANSHALLKIGDNIFNFFKLPLFLFFGINITAIKFVGTFSNCILFLFPRGGGNEEFSGPSSPKPQKRNTNKTHSTVAVKTMSSSSSSSPSPPSLKRFLSAHYVFNVIIILLYPLFYIWCVEMKDEETVEKVVNWTKQATYMTGLTLLLKLRRFETLDKFVADCFLHVKSSILLLSFIMDRKVFWIFGSLYYFHYLLCQLREYSGASKAEHLNVASFERRVKIGATKGEETKKWLVMFYAPWHPPCNQFDPTFAQLSLEFSDADDKDSGLTFAKFDLSRWPGGAIDHGIDLTGNSKQLPTLILFDNGGEIERMPRCTKQGVIENRVVFSRANVCERFGLKAERKELKKSK